MLCTQLTYARRHAPLMTRAHVPARLHSRQRVYVVGAVAVACDITGNRCNLLKYSDVPSHWQSIWRYHVPALYHILWDLRVVQFGITMARAVCLGRCA